MQTEDSHEISVLIFQSKKFLWLSLGGNQYWARRVYDLSVYYMMGAPKGSTESGSGEAGN